MKELVEVMAKSLVSNPSAVVVEEETTGTSTGASPPCCLKIWVKLLENRAALLKQSELSMKAVATRENVKVVVEIV